MSADAKTIIASPEDFPLLLKTPEIQQYEGTQILFLTMEQRRIVRQFKRSWP